jgi:hypothetical protein
MVTVPFSSAFSIMFTMFFAAFFSVTVFAASDFRVGTPAVKVIACRR